ncbi:MAG: 23S rRNA (pseudouridine(1915)-N(3))-methyltransferase RlmH [Oligoflexales bacterium]
MNIELVKVGKPSLREAEHLAGEYHKRLKTFGQLQVRLFRHEKQFLALTKNPDLREILLDEHGKQLSSPELSQELKAIKEQGVWRGVRFVVGGPDGFSDQAKSRADMTWSLSRAVFPSDIAWFLVAEQVYRGFSILSGHPYHRE